MKNTFCADCKFFKEGDSTSRYSEIGECRRYPPKVVEAFTKDVHPDQGMDAVVALSSFFPGVDQGAFCGEFQPS